MSPLTIPYILSTTVPRTASVWVGKPVGLGVTLGTACNELAYTAMFSATSNDSLILFYLVANISMAFLSLCAPSTRKYINPDGATTPAPHRPTKSRQKTKGNDGVDMTDTAR